MCYLHSALIPICYPYHFIWGMMD